jgi:translation initiation factor 2B subunit (eIF-2B alpha/beta/delta family)
MIASLRKRINRLTKDRQQGAGKLAEEAIDILRTACTESPAPTVAKLIAEMDQVTSALIEARPLMVSIANYVLQFQDDFGVIVAGGDSPRVLKKSGAAAAAALLKRAEASSEGAAVSGSKMISDRTIVMTCSYSSCVCNSLELARQKGVDFKVLALESLHEKISYGEMTRARLAKSGIVSRAVPDNQVGWQVARADIILIGTDAISLHGWLVNGIPSLDLATVAALRKVPVYAVGESSKLDSRGILSGVSRPEPGFDLIPLELIAGVITEKGTLTPDEVYQVTMDNAFGSPRGGTH